MKICESFNAWLETKPINENIASAKIFMQKMYARELDKSQSTLTKEEQDRALENPDYLRINKLVNPWPGYMLPFVKFHFEQGIPIVDPNPREANDIMDLKDLVEVIKNKKHIIQKLPKTIDQYANAENVGNANGFEQLTDEIGKIERFKEAKWFIDGLPKPLRDQYRSLDREKQNSLITSAILLSKLGKSSVDRLFDKIKAMANWSIEDFITYTANYVKGLEKSKQVIAEYQAKANAQIASLEKKNNEISNTVVTEYVDKIRTVKEKEYVYRDQAQNVVVAQSDLSNGWVYLHDSSSKGLPAVPARSADEASSGIKDNIALGTIVTNYSVCIQNANQLTGLQRWINDTKAAVDKANAEQEGK
jgi:hypothetical protein